MSGPSDTDDEALLAWLRAGHADTTDDIAADVRAVFGDIGPEHATTGTDDREEGMRALGLNYKERDALVRGQRMPQHGRTPRKYSNQRRFAWYLNRQVPDWTRTNLPRDYVVATWVRLTGDDLELAQRWWAAGVDPLDLEGITMLVDNSMSPRDLTTSVHGRTILEHLHRGTSVKWCLDALAFHWSA